jgi:hypothetical protein
MAIYRVGSPFEFGCAGVVFVAGFEGGVAAGLEGSAVAGFTGAAFAADPAGLGAAVVLTGEVVAGLGTTPEVDLGTVAGAVPGAAFC